MSADDGYYILKNEQGTWDAVHVFVSNLENKDYDPRTDGAIHGTFETLGGAHAFARGQWSEYGVVLHIDSEPLLPVEITSTYHLVGGDIYELYRVGEWTFEILYDAEGNLTDENDTVASCDAAIAAFTAWREFLREKEEK
jgi:hypothetical protein